MFYYIAAHDAGRSRLIAGPYATEPEAIAIKDVATKLLNEREPWSWFYTISLGKSHAEQSTLLGPIMPDGASPVRQMSGERSR